ncbi:MAG: pilus assembly protein [Anaerolineales bacterium]|nr:pilus assembly protein [Anaerolineales bacterium]
MKKLLQRLRPATQQGQSLVELAITAPILVFMLLGVFEVGWALRGYLVLTNISREITRYSVRQGYLDYAQKNNNPYTHTLPAAVTVGYDGVVSYSYRTLSEQVVLDFSDENTSTLIISHLVVDTGLACRPGTTCDCSQFVTNPNFYLNGTNVLTYDDLILHPDVRGYENFYAQTFPPTSTRVTQFNYPDEAAQLARENNKFNCELLRKSGGTIPASNNLIITEIFYNQPQLFGFPIISNPYTDPVPMYAHTAMRIIVSSRSGENVDTVGPVCDVYPFALKASPAFTINNEINILRDGWVKWNSTRSNSATYISDALKYSRMPLNDFKESGNPGDTSLNIGDRVAIDTSSYGQVLTDVRNLASKDIRIPVLNSSTSAIIRFIKVRVSNDYADLNPGGSPPTVLATYIEDFQVDAGGFPICLTSD